jgi:SPP1 family predicted phage head-tail adaptor
MSSSGFGNLIRNAVSVGDLRQRIVIESPTASSDGQGGLTGQTWSTLATVWARIDPMKAREESFAEKLRHVVTHRIIIRSRSDITAAMRVNFGGRIFQIHGVRSIHEMKRWTILDCEEGGVPS